MYSDPIYSEVLLDYSWDEVPSNTMHVLTVADSSKDVEVLAFKGAPPELEIPDYPENNAVRIPALKGPNGSYARTASDSLANEYSYISAPTPDGKAVLIDVYLDQVLVLDEWGNRYAKYSLPSGTFAKLISATSDTESMWLLYWEHNSFNGGNKFRIEQRLLVDGSLVEYEALDWVHSETHLAPYGQSQWLMVYSEPQIDDWYAVFSEPTLDTDRAVESQPEIVETSQAVYGEGELFIDYAVGSETLLDVADLYVLSEVELGDISWSVYSEAEILQEFSYVISTVDFQGTLGTSDYVLSETVLGDIEVHAWVTLVDRGGVGYASGVNYWTHVGLPDTTKYGLYPPYLQDFDLMDINHEWTIFSNVTGDPSGLYDRFYVYNDPYSKPRYIPGLDRHIQFGDEQWFDAGFTGFFDGEVMWKNTRPITSPAIQASESNLYFINTFDRKWLNLRDDALSEGDPDRRTSRSVLYRLDKSSKRVLRGVKPTVVSMSCAYGRAATDALGLIMADTFVDEDYSRTWTSWLRTDLPISESSILDKLFPTEPVFKEGDMMIVDEQFNLVYDEIKAFPILPSSYQTATWMQKLEDDSNPFIFGGGLTRGDTITNAVRQLSTVHAYGKYIIVACAVESMEAYLKTGASSYAKYLNVPTRVRFKLYDIGKNTYQILGGKQGTILGYSIREFYNYIASEVALLPEDAYYYLLSETQLYAHASSMVHSETIIQIDEVVHSEVFLDVPNAVLSEVVLGHVGYRTAEFIITNTSPACTANRAAISMYTDLWDIPTTEEVAYWDESFDRLSISLMNKDFTPIDQSIYWPVFLNHSVGCYPSYTTIWTRNSDLSVWMCAEETAMFNTINPAYYDGIDVEQLEMSVPLPVQYAADEESGVLFGFFRPADGELTTDTRTVTTYLDMHTEEAETALPCFANMTWFDYYKVSVTGQWYTMGCRLYKFNAPNTKPISISELQDQYQNTAGAITDFTYRHFGVDTTRKELLLVRCKSKLHPFSVPHLYGADNEYMRLTLQSYVETPTWDDFYECLDEDSVVQKDPVYWPIEEIQFEGDTDYATRDLVVLDYDFSVKYAVGVGSIDGLRDDDVIQHAVGRDGYIFIFTQVREEVPFDWSVLFTDWFSGDTELMKRYGHMEVYSVYRKARVYAVNGTLRTGTARMLHEFDIGSFGQDNVVIQEVTDTHVWLNWDGVRLFMSGPFSGIGVRLDGTGIDYVPGLVAVVKDVYEQGWQLITYPRMESAPKMTTGMIQDYGAGVGGDISTSGYFEYGFQTPTFWGDTQILGFSTTPPNVGYYNDVLGPTYYARNFLSDLRILDEENLIEIERETSRIWHSYYDMFGRFYWIKPACQPAASTFLRMRLYDWVYSEVDLKGVYEVTTPTTWISTNEGTNGALIL